MLFIYKMIQPATANDYMMKDAVLGGIWNEIKTGFNDKVLHGDADSKGKYAGSAIWTAITLFNPEGKIGDLGKVDKAINIVDKADEGEKLINDREDVTNVVSKAIPEKVVNDLANYESKKWIFGNEEFILDKSGMKHILERHHLEY